MALYGNLPALAKLPPDNVGLTPVQIATQCGNSPTSPPVPLPGSVSFPCANYLQQFYWSLDRGFDAPDAGGAGPSIYNNYDFSYSHQFADGIALKVTPFYKLGTSLPTSSLLLTLPGGSQIFSEASKGINRTTGAEFSLTTRITRSASRASSPARIRTCCSRHRRFRTVSSTAFRSSRRRRLRSATSTAPATYRRYRCASAERTTSPAALASRRSSSSIPVSPTTSETRWRRRCRTAPNANIPQVNFGAGAPILLGYQNAGGTHFEYQLLRPGILGIAVGAKHRGDARKRRRRRKSGGVTWYPNVQFNLTFQYKHGRDTVGVQFIDIGTNGYNGTTPRSIRSTSPVANGVSGPQTGQNTCTAQYGAARGCAAIPSNAYAFSNGAYILTNGNIGAWQLAPLAPMAVSVFYRRQF